MKKRTLILLLVLVVVAVGGFLAFRMYDERTPDIVNRKPDVAIDVAGIIAAFEKDTAAAGKQFMDRIVEIKGNVKSIDTTGAVVLGEEGNPSEVVVGLDRRHLDDHKKLTIGKTFILQGICSGYTKGSGDPDDLLASLGTTIQFRSAGVKEKQ